uniref:Uncharacterized protein n=1 Tax=Romanomermis culicivorax TaxID=13658 RepID=A0A915HJF6_ROMCU
MNTQTENMRKVRQIYDYTFNLNLMGKKNSKLKPDEIKELARQTYCKLLETICLNLSMNSYALIMQSKN